MKARTAIFIAKCRGREEILLGTESTIGVNGRIAFSLTRCDANGMAALKPLPDLQRLKLNLNHPNCFARELYQLYRPFEYKPSTSVPYLKKCGRLKAPVLKPGDESDASGFNRIEKCHRTNKEPRACHQLNLEAFQGRHFKESEPKSLRKLKPMPSLGCTAN